MADLRPGGDGSGRGPARGRAALLAAGAVLVAGGVAAGLIVVLPGKQAAAGGQSGSGQSGAVQVATAPVVRTDLVNTVQVGGSLGYAGSFTILDEMQGTAYTALPQPGQVVRRGQRLYEVDGSPVMLFYGSRPGWRDLSLGVADGPDVAQLDANLIALGYASAATLTVSDTFTAATAYAVERWQAAAGLAGDRDRAARAGCLRSRAVAGHRGDRRAGRDGRAGRTGADRDISRPGGDRGAAGGPGVPGDEG